MKTLDQEIFDFVEHQEHCELTTEKGIIISVEDDNFLEAEFTLADTEKARLSISFCREKKEFVKLLGITSLQDLFYFPLGSFIEMYYEGFAEMVCFVDMEFTYCMSFQKLGNRIIAVNEKEVKHIIPKYERLETPRQFMAYAKRYYELMECFEN